ncbi:hypothetical protein L226DRAFT_530919 [Lentinus tigrinus ALCF2SS1-7]|uniref:Uncharacterized protein n=1 Tax=Lentinus tigrinus ALCF2SS1-6 TaxID=1328759 RepID=A0A5C2SWM4_9APHY|nr:hypothetical protein L227DRAFT_649584 [Lentinus tigrinus ALCF2SS1-6]RPD79093.1 hypothetical protein L226DRAFT_530919 [Lentinus tigrinus ALCF2SS1-7]
MHPCSVIVLVLTGLLNGALAQFGPLPPMLIPSKGDVWNVGELRTVEWGITSDTRLTNETSGAPLTAFVILAYDSGQVLNPVLLESYQLAAGFPVSQKMVNIIVPEVPTRKDYSIFMNFQGLGTSWSAAFEIFNPKDPQGTGVAPTSFSVITAPPISVTVVLPTPTDNAASTTTSAAASPTSSTSATSTSSATASATGSPNSGAYPLSHNDLLAGAGIILLPLLSLVHAVL